ncbi:MAG: 2-oxoglutarate dehydrogenase complex dihydrolipoyllysine-residue succinyltransferase [Proteobacteria bacterium]|nr:2-oxoglutarate dehydrogenase complex dihydrolipoyllysine-residue succinyltransferase [Pseudomonadota bacterium]
MSTIDIKVPALGESVNEATIGKWLVKPGESVAADTALVELETDKVTLEVYAPADGKLDEILAKSGTIVKIGAILAKFTAGKIEKITPVAPAQQEEKKPTTTEKPAAQHGQSNVEEFIMSAKKTKATSSSAREELRVPMSRLRQRIAERLKDAQNTAAMLTTFNEVDMSAVMQLRTLYKDKFEKSHGVKLGFMSFFVKSCVQALKEQPILNSCIDGQDIITKTYFDIGVAVSTPNGLVVPIIRDADHLSLADVEKTIAEMGQKARDGKLTIEEMTGGTFTITNGGVFGSLLSTPILNPPQSAILGMHKIQDRPVVVNGQIVIRPMMYLALSYDHRLVDGKDAVTFLVTIKECLENPGRFLLDL